MNDLYVLIAGGILLVAGIWVWIQSRGTVQPPSDERQLFSGVSIEPQPVLSDAELSLYNLIKLAVQDRYLVFCQMPVWGLVKVQTAESSTRSRLLSKIALRRVDVVLVHPGTRTVKKAIIVDDQLALGEESRRRDQLVAAVLKVAGISVVRLDPTQSHSVPSLAMALGLDPVDPESDDP